MHLSEDDPFCLMPRLIPNAGDGGKGDSAEPSRHYDQHGDEATEPLNLSLNGAENW